jgi:DNA-binding transcriptional regulator YiaG
MNHYHYQECGLDNIWLENGFEFHETPYGKGVSFINAETLDATIAKVLTEKPAPLTGKEFRFLRIMLDMSQKTVGELMGKEAQTVALWEKSDALKPDVDFLFRHIYRQTAINRNDNYRELVERLNHTDRCENDARMLFKVTETGWDKAA